MKIKVKDPVHTKAAIIAVEELNDIASVQVDIRGDVADQDIFDICDYLNTYGADPQLIRWRRYSVVADGKLQTLYELVNLTDPSRPVRNSVFGKAKLLTGDIEGSNVKMLIN